MATRLTPIDARSIAEAKVKAERAAKEAERLQKRRESRARASEERAWNTQAQKMLLAAVEGSSEITLDEQLVRPNQLLNAGLAIFVCSGSADERADAERLVEDATSSKASAASEIREAVASWLQLLHEVEPGLRAHKHEVRKELNQLIKEALAQTDPHEIISLSFVLRMESAELLSVLDIEEISEFAETDAVDNALESYCIARANLKEAKRSLSLFSSSPSVPVDSISCAESEPPYSVQWQPVSSGEPWNDRALISADGLGWICGKPGQALILELEQIITKSAEQQKKSVLLEVAYSNALNHYIEDRQRRRVLFPPEIEMVEILASLGWNASTAGEPESQYQLEISW